MHWRYEWVAELPRDVYDVLVELLNADLRETELNADAANRDV